MAQFLTHKQLNVHLSSSNDLDVSNINRSIIGLVHGIETRNDDEIRISFILKEGNGVIATISHQVWLRWKHLIIVGKILKFDCFVQTEIASTKSFVISAIGQVLSACSEFYKFKLSRTPLDSDTVSNMMVLKWISVIERPHIHPKAPLMASCYSRNGDLIYLKIHHRNQSSDNKIRSLATGTFVHFGPVIIQFSYFHESNIEMHTTPDTVFYEHLPD